MTLKILIAEDVPATREAIVKLTSQHPELEVIAEVDSVAACRKAIDDHSPIHGLFLDIRLIGGYAWDILRKLREDGQVIPPVVIISGEEEKGQAQVIFQEFHGEIVDYYVKPMQNTWRIRHDVTVERIRKRNAEIKEMSISLNKAKQPAIRQLEITEGKVTRFVPVKNIACLQRTEMGTEIYFVNDEPRFRDVYGALDHYLKKFQDTCFVRVSRKAIVNINHIDRLENTLENGGQVVLAGVDIDPIACTGDGFKRVRSALRH